VVSEIRFEKHSTLDLKTNRRSDEVVIIRDGREAAVLPEASRLGRGMSLSLEEAVWVAQNFHEIMHRPPSAAERAFWQAVVDYKRSHVHTDVHAA